MTAAPAVEGVGLSKSFGRVQAVTDLDISVADGEILALMGPSGCGKTTVLRLIAGFERPDRGRVAIGGRHMAGQGRYVPPEGRHVGMVFQEYALFPHMTVLANVNYGLNAARNGHRAVEVLRLAGLTGLEHRYPHELSGGQQQRVALARALAPQPAVMLLDEPFSNLDARLRRDVREEVRDVLKSTGTSAIFVTHDQDEGLFMGDRVAVMVGGAVAQVGTPEQVFQLPATRFVAEFLGDTSFIAGRVTALGVETELGALPQACALAPGTEVQVLVRPDDLVVRRLEGGPAEVSRRIYRGMHNWLVIRLPSGHSVIGMTDHTDVLAPGTRVEVALTRKHPLAVFCGDTAVSGLAPVTTASPDQP